MEKGFGGLYSTQNDGRGFVDRKQRGLILEETEKPGEKDKAPWRNDWGAASSCFGWSGSGDRGGDEEVFCSGGGPARRPGGWRVWLCSRGTMAICNRPSEHGNSWGEEEKWVRAAVTIHRWQKGSDLGAGGRGACGDWYKLGGEGVRAGAAASEPGRKPGQT